MIAFLMVRRTPAPAEPAPQTTNLFNQNMVMTTIMMTMMIVATTMTLCKPALNLGIIDPFYYSNPMNTTVITSDLIKWMEWDLIFKSLGAETLNLHRPVKAGEHSGRCSLHQHHQLHMSLDPLNHHHHHPYHHHNLHNHHFQHELRKPGCRH